MNEYKTAARKYRPQSLSQLVGQQHITKALSNAINSKRISHAYLFSGPRGTGKTSSARILAKSLSCINGITTEPCQKCHNCIEITNGSSYDILEIDGASNRGIDQIRELRDNINYLPSKAPYKIIIIDEVHMLTDQAFNSLLKTLEEPPQYVIFIFATTEVHKVKLTIRSRCEHYNFRLITEQNIEKQLKYIAETEDININKECLAKIAKAAGGSMRDALNLFDQVVSYSNKDINIKLIDELFGYFPNELFYKFIDKLIDKDSLSLIEITNSLINNGDNINNFIQGISETFRNIIIIKQEIKQKKEGFILSLTKNERDILGKYENSFTDKQIIEIINLLASLEQELKKTLNEQYTFETYIFRLLNYENFVNQTEILNKISKIEKNLIAQLNDESYIKENKEYKPKTHRKTTENKDKDNSKIESHNKKTYEDFSLDKIKTTIEDANPILASFLNYVNEHSLNDKVLLLHFHNEIYFDKVSSKKNIKQIEDTIYKLFAKQIKVKTKLTDKIEQPKMDKKKQDPILDIVDKFKGEIIS